MKFLKHKEGILFLLLLLLAWIFVSGQTQWGSAYLFPSPEKTAKAFLSSGRLFKDTCSSFTLLFPAFFLASALAIALGVVAGSVPWVNRLLKPFSRFASPIPPNIYIPYAIALLPTFRMAAGFVVFVAAFWPVFLNSAVGAASLPKCYRDNTATLGITGVEFIWRIALVGALPHIFAGLSAGLGISFIMLTVAELVGTNYRLGYFIQFKADYSEYDGMAAGILYTGLVVFIVMELLEFARRKLLFWTQTS